MITMIDTDVIQIDSIHEFQGKGHFIDIKLDYSRSKLKILHNHDEDYSMDTDYELRKKDLGVLIKYLQTQYDSMIEGK